ncbi:MAG: GNAT family N-acetyltransferase [Propionibacteriales bacterium]|nr:GNAT family N-acetyltransferase [Propionibacteriales bacterium]
MELEEFAPDDLAAVDAYVGIIQACNDHDAPWEVPLTRSRQRQEMRFGWDGEVPRYLLVRDGGRPVGTICFFASEHDNLELSWIELRIAPEHRRQGLGRAALAGAFEFSLAAGRPLVILEQAWDSPAVRALAAAFDLPMRQVSVRRVQDLAGDDDELARFRALRAEAEERSATYDLVRVLGPTPVELLDGLVTVTEAINDAPVDDLEYEDEVYDVARIQGLEQAQAAAGYRLLRVIAVERSTGVVAGHSLIRIDTEQPEYAEQDDTTVLGDHRGHRLGLRMKADMLCWLATDEPQVRRILTENAESNEPMIAVNERLGYRVVGRELLYQCRLEV